MRVVFRSHSQTALLPVEIAQMFSRGTTTVDACGVNLVVAVRLEVVEDGGGGGEVVDACLFDAWRCEHQAWRYSTLERSTERSGRYRQVLGNIGNGTFQSFQNGRGRAKITGVGLPHLPHLNFLLVSLLIPLLAREPLCGPFQASLLLTKLFLPSCGPSPSLTGPRKALTTCTLTRNSLPSLTRISKERTSRERASRERASRERASRERVSREYISRLCK